MVVKILTIVQKFIDDLDNTTQTKVYKGVRLLREFGLKLNYPHSRKIGDNLYELRALGKIQTRLVYCFNKDYGIIIHGFVKKSQKIPIKEIELAEQRKKDLQTDN
jgi:phage-related protein